MVKTQTDEGRLNKNGGCMQRLPVVRSNVQVSGLWKEQPQAFLGRMRRVLQIPFMHQVSIRQTSSGRSQNLQILRMLLGVIQTALLFLRGPTKPRQAARQEPATRH